jgi:hypothetical protein
VRGFGGATRHWTRPGDESWAARPLDPIDFEVRPGLRNSGWPFDHTHLDPYLAQSQASVVELATEDDPTWVDRVELRREDGSRSSVRARLVVLTAGGIENPRLLLLSRQAHRSGLGHGHDLVGRFFAERMSARTGYIVPASPELIGRAGRPVGRDPRQGPATPPPAGGDGRAPA